MGNPALGNCGEVARRPAAKRRGHLCALARGQLWGEVTSPGPHDLVSSNGKFSIPHFQSELFLPPPALRQLSGAGQPGAPPDGAGSPKPAPRGPRPQHPRGTPPASDRSCLRGRLGRGNEQPLRAAGQQPGTGGRLVPPPSTHLHRRQRKNHEVKQQQHPGRAGHRTGFSGAPPPSRAQSLQSGGRPGGPRPPRPPSPGRPQGKAGGLGEGNLRRPSRGAAPGATGAAPPLPLPGAGKSPQSRPAAARVRELPPRRPAPPEGTAQPGTPKP